MRLGRERLEGVRGAAPVNIRSIALKPKKKVDEEKEEGG